MVKNATLFTLLKSRPENTIKSVEQDSRPIKAAGIGRSLRPFSDDKTSMKGFVKKIG